jgi:hypothetical protein
MNKLEIAKKIIDETKLNLINHVNKDRNTLIKTIKESSNYNILYYAANGTFPKDKNVPVKNLLEQAVKKSGNKTYLNELGITTALGVAAAITLITKAAQLYFTRAERAAQKACEKYRGNEKVSCVTRHKVNSLKIKLSKLESGIDKCNQSVNPEVCKREIKEKIAKLKEKIQKVGMTL